MGAMVAVYLVFEMLWFLKEIVCSRKGVAKRQYGVEDGEVVEVVYVWDKNISLGPKM